MTSDEVPVTAVARTEDTAGYTYDELLPGTTSQPGVKFLTTGSPDLVVVGSLVIVCIFGFVANAAMLVGLLTKRPAAPKKTVNVFVCNQTVLDLVATFVLVLKQSLLMSGYYWSNRTGVLRISLSNSRRV